MASQHNPTSYISLLRGINVGGHRSIKMSELKTIYENVNCTKVKTLKTSGNVVFEYLHRDDTVQNLEEALSQEIMKRHSYVVPVLIRTVQELKQIIKNNPYYSRDRSSHKDLYVTLLADTPSDEAIKEVCDQRKSFEPDEFQIEGRTIYMKLESSAAKTKLTNTFLERKFKTQATTRNWTTMLELETLASNKK
ncbi:hypothetical protein C9374_007934 [Naegleria lovaniensis]|uniref:DUF1697 domain-containing protein n=1 Tax=Naegleria lovaniensis TaxID=51637 RepID=A0AA88GLQ7_NAELO|nr:uncharacterized protein C9374_007934 [Naegleria lovaniensis]KAG2378786.1 hypothetical protein C9374_007934 [Naegleria lovaniensis]